MLIVILAMIILDLNIILSYDILYLESNISCGADINLCIFHQRPVCGMKRYDNLHTLRDQLRGHFICASRRKIFRNSYLGVTIMP